MPPDAPPDLLTPEQVSRVFARFAEHTPTPRGELNYTNPYTLLVAVVLSARATDRGVNAATEALFRRVSTPRDMLDLGEEALCGLIGTIGLFRSKAKYLIAGARQLIERHAGEVPSDMDSLTALPGVGRKTANVVRNTAFGLPGIAVDTHVFRVARRTGLSASDTHDGVEQDLNTRVPADRRQHAHHWLILHGRYVCRARRPGCSACIIRDLCAFPDKVA